MKRAALAFAVAAALPVALAAACGTQEWAFLDPSLEHPGEASLDAAIFEAEVLDAPDGDGDANDGPCDPEASRCPISCANGMACPASAPVCTQPHAICQECHSNQDCSTVRSGPVCTQNGQCAPECSSAQQCPSSRPHCARSIGRCVRCLDNGDCPSGQVCFAYSLSCGMPRSQ